MRELPVHEQVARILRAATGEESPDGNIVTDIAEGYSEPGYDRDAYVVFGNWNPPRFPRDGDAPLTKAERLAPRLGDLLERVGAEVEWLDEWTNCSECYRAVRTEPNSYSWKPSFAWIGEYGPVCAQCLREDIATSLDDGNYVNNASTAVTWCDSSDLAGAGWEQWEPGNEQRYQNGWHEGMTDDPKTVLAEINRERPDADVVFLLDESSQFYISFSAWTREDEDADMEGDEQ